MAFIRIGMDPQSSSVIRLAVTAGCATLFCMLAALAAVVTGAGLVYTSFIWCLAAILGLVFCFNSAPRTDKTDRADDRARRAAVAAERRREQMRAAQEAYAPASPVYSVSETIDVTCTVIN